MVIGIGGISYATFSSSLNNFSESKALLVGDQYIPLTSPTNGRAGRLRFKVNGITYADSKAPYLRSIINLSLPTGKVIYDYSITVRIFGGGGGGGGGSAISSTVYGFAGDFSDSDSSTITGKSITLGTVSAIAASGGAGGSPGNSGNSGQINSFVLEDNAGSIVMSLIAFGGAGGGVGATSFQPAVYQHSGEGMGGDGGLPLQSGKPGKQGGVFYSGSYWYTSPSG